MSVPSTTLEPRSGRSKPISDFKNTDLPVPEGPSRTLTSPSGIVIETSSQIRWDPKDFVKPSTWIPMPMRIPPADVAHRSPSPACGLSHCSAQAHAEWATATNVAGGSEDQPRGAHL